MSNPNDILGKNDAMPSFPREENKPFEDKETKVKRALNELQGNEKSELGILDDIKKTIKDFIKDHLGDTEAEKALKEIEQHLVKITEQISDDKSQLRVGLDKEPRENVTKRLETCNANIRFIASIYNHSNENVRKWASANSIRLNNMNSEIDTNRKAIQEYLDRTAPPPPKPVEPAPAPAPAPAPTPTPPTPEDKETKEKDQEILNANGLVKLCEEYVKRDRNGKRGFDMLSVAKKNEFAQRMVAINRRMTEIREDAAYAHNDDKLKKIAFITGELSRYYRMFFPGQQIPK